MLYWGLHREYKVHRRNAFEPPPANKGVLHQANKGGPHQADRLEYHLAKTGFAQIMVISLVGLRPMSR